MDQADVKQSELLEVHQRSAQKILGTRIEETSHGQGKQLVGGGRTVELYRERTVGIFLSHGAR